MLQIIEMLIKIKNGQAVKKETISVPYSNFKFNVAKLLEKEGFVGETKKRGRDKKRIVIKLKYDNKTPKIHGVKLISKPGRRIYLEKKELYLPKAGHGILIVSTPKGLLTSKEARKVNTGGEAVCEVW